MITITPTASPTASVQKIALVPTRRRTGAATRAFSIPIRAFRGHLSFTPDGKAIGLFDPSERRGKSLASTARWLARAADHEFPGELIDTYHWSPDGKSLGMIRSHTESDVVLLRESGTTTQ